MTSRSIANRLSSSYFLLCGLVFIACITSIIALLQGRNAHSDLSRYVIPSVRLEQRIISTLNELRLQVESLEQVNTNEELLRSRKVLSELLSSVVKLGNAMNLIGSDAKLPSFNTLQETIEVFLKNKELLLAQDKRIAHGAEEITANLNFMLDELQLARLRGNLATPSDLVLEVTSLIVLVESLTELEQRDPLQLQAASYRSKLRELSQSLSQLPKSSLRQQLAQSLRAISDRADGGEHDWLALLGKRTEVLQNLELLRKGIVDEEQIILKKVELLNQSLKGSSERALEQVENIIARLYLSLWILLGASTLISLFIVRYVVYKNVIHRLKLLTQSMTRLSQGELEVEIADDYPDEIGAAYEALKVFRQTAQTLREQKTFTEAILESSPVGLLGVDRDGKIQFMNATLCSIFGYSPTELRYENLELLIPDDRKIRHQKHFEDYLKAPRERFMSARSDLAGRRKDGSLIPIEIVLRPLHHEEVILAAVMDVTERKATERRVRLTQFAIDNAQDSIFFVKEDGSFEYANLQASNKLGYDLHELIQMKVDRVDRKLADGYEWVAQFSRVREEGFLVMESEHRRKDGAMYACEVRDSFLEFEGEALVVRFVRDISEEKRRAAFRSVLFDKSSNPHFICDETGIIDCNDMAVEILGYGSREALLGIHPSHLSPERQADGRLSAEKYREIEQIVLEKGYDQFEWLHTTKHGEILPCEVTVRTVETEKGRALLVVWQDLRGQKRAEEQRTAVMRLNLEMQNTLRKVLEVGLQEGSLQTRLEQALKVILESKVFSAEPKGGIFLVESQDPPLLQVVTTQGMDLAANRAVTSFNSDDQRSYAGLPVDTEILKTDGLLQMPIVSADRLLGVLVLSEQDHLQAAERQFMIALSQALAAVIENSQLQERIEAERKALIESNTKLERSNQDLDQFAYVASHDLKAPLRAITHYCNWISEDVGDNLPERSRDHLEKLRSRVGRMQQLLDDLLAYSRVDRDVDEVNIIETKSLVSEIIELIQPPAGFEITVDENLPCLETAKVPLELVIRNLVSNAIKHHNRGQGKIAISSKMYDHWCEFTIADDGPGIAPEYHQKIFEMFQSLKAGSGTGMGLAIVKKVVEGKGGRVSVESKEGAGASFHFTWPLKALPDLSVSSRPVPYSSS